MSIAGAIMVYLISREAAMQNASTSQKKRRPIFGMPLNLEQF